MSLPTVGSPVAGVDAATTGPAVAGPTGAGGAGDVDSGMSWSMLRLGSSDSSRG
ncbi:MAG TPA: hypothetical protein VFA01_02235 [Candidatus Dormibacteraeota bacterium]|nr:hypothetical protein [Candidatus Dormibacteraeota bacterium]